MHSSYSDDVKRKVLVTGAQGVSGRAVVEHYSGLPDTKVYGLSRRTSPGENGVEHISVDLLDPKDIRAKLSGIHGVTPVLRSLHRQAGPD